MRLEPAPISISSAGGTGSRKRRASAVKGIIPANSARKRTRYGLVRLLASPPIKSPAPHVAADKIPYKMDSKLRFPFVMTLRQLSAWF